MSKLIESTFNKGAEGWTIQDGSTASWSKTGGDPGGCFNWSDSNGDDSYYAAPAAFLGDKHGFYGGVLSYDIKDSANEYGGVPDVELVGHNGMTLVATVGQAGTDWTTLSIELDKTAHWRIGDLSGDKASKADIKAVLADLDGLWIRAEYHVGNETGALDNVILSKTAAAAADPAHGHFAESHHNEPLAHAHSDLSHMMVV